MNLRNVVNRSSNVERELKTLRRDLSRLRGDFNDVVNAFSDNSRQNYEQVREEVRDWLNDLNKRYTDARQVGQDQWQRAEREIGKRPLRLGLIAITFGFVVTALASLFWTKR